jgi:hypothetical protein
MFNYAVHCRNCKEDMGTAEFMFPRYLYTCRFCRSEYTQIDRPKICLSCHRTEFDGPADFVGSLEALTLCPACSLREKQQSANGLAETQRMLLTGHLPFVCSDCSEQGWIKPQDPIAIEARKMGIGVELPCGLILSRGTCPKCS